MPGIREEELMSDVTTAFVRKHYAQGPTAYFEDGTIAKMPTAEDVQYAGAQFDRWLASHDEGQQIKGVQRLLDYRPLPCDVRRYIEGYLETWAEESAQQREVGGQS
jgi:hypothetical protein